MSHRLHDFCSASTRTRSFTVYCAPQPDLVVNSFAMTFPGLEVVITGSQFRI